MPRHITRRRSLALRPFLLEGLEDRLLLSVAPKGLEPLGAGDEPKYVANEILIQYNPDVTEAQKVKVRGKVRAAHKETIRKAGPKDAKTGDLELASLAPDLDVAAAIQAFEADPNVAFAEPNWILTHMAESNDTSYKNGSLWGMYSDDLPSPVGPDLTTNAYGSQAEKAWAAGNTGSNTVYVGIIDEGIDFNHPDLAANIWTNTREATGTSGFDDDGNGYVDDVRGWDFANNDNTIYDGAPGNTTDQHGTHVAGTIGAVGGEGSDAIGVAGVNWNVTMISGKFLNPGGGSIANAIKAVDYFTDLKKKYIADPSTGANIVATNNSWGGGGYSQALHFAIERAKDANILFIAAAGNSGINNDNAATYPANYESSNVISVGAIDKLGNLAGFSNYGARMVHLGAPGVDILSTTPNNTYSSFNGTSMATPHVTGAAALYAAMHRDFSASQIKGAIIGSAIRRPTASLTGRTIYGGRLNVNDMGLNDLDVTAVVPSSTSVAQGGEVKVYVTVENKGTQDRTDNITVTLQWDNVTIDTKTIGGLAAGTSTTVTFIWNTSASESPGDHVLTASLGTTDEISGNDTRTAKITVIDPNAPKGPQYLTVADAGTVTLGGLAVQNEDIVLYDKGVYTLFFDGTLALGGTSGGFAIDALAIISANEFLISVDQYGGINGANLTVYDEDIIRFARSSPSAAWFASMYFDGSDVGLTSSIFGGTTGAEGVDAIERLSDGKILISTKGNFSVSGLSGADEDVIVFTPTTTGPSTKGSWKMYFDGSNYGLGESWENEDVDGISVDVNGKLYLSTEGNFTVLTPKGSLTGTGSDVFVYSGGAYSPTLHFAGSTLGGKNLFSIDLPPGYVSPSSASSQMGLAMQAQAAPYESVFADSPQDEETPHGKRKKKSSPFQTL